MENQSTPTSQFQQYFDTLPKDNINVRYYQQKQTYSPNRQNTLNFLQNLPSRIQDLKHFYPHSPIFHQRVKIYETQRFLLPYGLGSIITLAIGSQVSKFLPNKTSLRGGVYFGIFLSQYLLMRAIVDYRHYEFMQSMWINHAKRLNSQKLNDPQKDGMDTLALCTAFGLKTTVIQKEDSKKVI